MNWFEVKQALTGSILTAFSAVGKNSRNSQHTLLIVKNMKISFTTFEVIT